jgi:hypothetical protein
MILKVSFMHWATEGCSFGCLIYPNLMDRPHSMMLPPCDADFSEEGRIGLRNIELKRKKFGLTAKSGFSEAYND